MINKKEQAICKRRGHGVRAIGDGWAQCKWCGVWTREVRTIEEREDAPPADELNPMARIERRQTEREQKLKKKASAKS